MKYIYKFLIIAGIIIIPGSVFVLITGYVYNLISRKRNVQNIG